MESLKIIREKTLSDCPPEKAFWTCNGVVCRNIYELVSSMDGMSDYAFKYHVNADNHKNDFATWIKDVLHDDVLAERLHAIIEKDRYSDVIRERVKELENA